MTLMVRTAAALLLVAGALWFVVSSATHMPRTRRLLRSTSLRIPSNAIRRRGRSRRSRHSLHRRRPLPRSIHGHPKDFELPTGEEAPSEARGGIVETIVQIFACANGGDQLASYGGMTDAWFEALLASGAFGDDPVASLSAAPEALPEDAQTELLDTREFTLYEDGRTGVLVYYRTPTGEATGEAPVQIDLWIFKEEDGRWLLDEMVSGLEAQLGDVATPPAG